MAEPNRIYIAGHNGMVGAAILRKLSTKNRKNVIITRSHSELDLKDQKKVQEFFKKEKPTHVYIAAAKVGGIHANNTYPADFIYANLMIQSNVIAAAFQSGVKKLLFLGSSCIYPKHAPQPIPESSLLTGPLEATNEPYAIAKIAGIKLCESYNRQYGDSHGIEYRSIMPTNLYGPGDNYHPTNSHVIPALIRRFHQAKAEKSPTVTVWGTGSPLREFLHVDDMASACIHVMNLEKYTRVASLSHINAGSGFEITIRELAHIIGNIVDFKGEIGFDKKMPDGTPRKLLDSSLLKSLGWKPAFEFESGIKNAYEDFLHTISNEGHKEI